MLRLAAIASILVAAAFLLPGGRVTRPARAYSCQAPTVFGDINGNHSVGPEDALWLLRDVARLVNPEGGCSPEDVDCDGAIDAVDALKILPSVAGLPYSQVKPCPAIGAVVD